MRASRLLPALGGTLALAAILGACEDERAILSEPVGERAYGLQLLPPGVQRIPRGNAFFRFRTATLSDSIQVKLVGLDSLENGFYTVWIGDSLGTSFKRATGHLTRIRTDTVLDALGDPTPSTTSSVLSTSISAFPNGGPRDTLIFRTTRAMSGLAASDSMHTVLVTIEETNSATAPSENRRVIWAQRNEATGAASRTVPIRFGRYAPLVPDQYRFIPVGRGRVLIRGDVMLLNDSSLSRPPRGYYYAVYAVRRDDQNQPVDTVFLGPLMNPNRTLSYLHADSILVDPANQTELPPAIAAGSVRASADTIPAFRVNGRDFAEFANVYVTLESKHKTPDRLGTVIVLEGVIPTVVRNQD